MFKKLKYRKQTSSLVIGLHILIVSNISSVSSPSPNKHFCQYHSQFKIVLHLSNIISLHNITFQRKEKKVFQDLITAAVQKKVHYSKQDWVLNGLSRKGRKAKGFCLSFYLCIFISRVYVIPGAPWYRHKDKQLLNVTKNVNIISIQCYSIKTYSNNRDYIV